MELISKEQAIDALKQQADTMSRWSERYAEQRKGVLTAVNIVEDLPTIQPEIVRCGECKWFQCNMRPDGYLPQGVDEFECRHWCGSCDPTDFCSYGEKERGEQDG